MELCGNRYGKLTVIGPSEKQAKGDIFWLCRCDCGKELSVLQKNLLHGHSRSCGCSRSPDRVGQRFGKLTVIARSDRREPRGKRTVPQWECRCDCGEIVYRSMDRLTGGSNCACRRCAEAETQQKMVKSAGFIGGTQMSKIREMKPPVTNTSGVRGVYLDRRNGKWRARIRFQNQMINLGTYANFDDAVKARYRGEEKYYGAFLAQYGNE